MPAAAVPSGDTVAQALPVPTPVVASDDDPYCAPDVGSQLAERWRATQVVAGRLGHITSDSDLRDRPFGRALLRAFVAGLRPTLAPGPVARR